MSFDFNFKISPRDLENLSRNPGGITTLQELLTSLPEFIGQDDHRFRYSDRPDDFDRWPRYITLQFSGFCLSLNSIDPELSEYLFMTRLIHKILCSIFVNKS